MIHKPVTDLVTRNIEIHGSSLTPDFVDWIIQRATRLSLSGWALRHGDDLIELSITGERVLVDAMEVACSLGPIEAVVDSIVPGATVPTAPNYRQTGDFVEYCTQYDE